MNIEIRRQLPIFLEVINYKRRKENEPKVEENQVYVTTFLDIGNQDDVEIIHASEIYISVMRRLVKEAREQIKEIIMHN